MEQKKKVIAVIVTYNRKELLKECINALLQQDYNNCDILVVDNASTDGTKDFILEELQNNKVHYENTGSNLGGAGGFNFGMKKACELGCDFIWVMDDDCIVNNDSLTELIKADKKLNGNYGFLSSKVLWKDNSICIMNKQKKTFSKWFKDFDSDCKQIAMASFVSLFVKKEIVMELGLPIKEFFIWTDDWEYTRRISRKHPCYYIGKSIVTHKCKENIGASIASVPEERLDRFKYMYRNDVVLYRREGLNGKILLKLRIILHKLRILKSEKKDKKERMNIINKALEKGKKFYPIIEYPLQPNKKIKVLEFFGEPLNYGGQEAFITNMYKNFEHNNFYFDFITPFDANNEKLFNLTQQYNDKIISYNYNFHSNFRKIYIVKTAKKVLKNGYDVIHIHSGSIFTLYKVAKIAKKNNVKNIIVHSHATGVNNFKYKIIKKISDINLEKNTDYFLACSDLAAKWKFPPNIVKNKKYIIIKNGIDLEEFEFKIDKREEYRKKFNLENFIVLCNVGRFSKEKNQIFLLKVFKFIKEKTDNYKLVLVGSEGNEEKHILRFIEENHLENDVIILKNRNDINNILFMSDIFVFPSQYEGLGMVAIESQTAGLITICSENVPNDVDISNLYKKLILKDGYEYWGKFIFNIKISKDRKSPIDSIKQSGYDAKESAKILEKVYKKIK